MSRKKGKSKAKGSAKNTPRKATSNRQSSQGWPAPNTTTPKFSLADEARWMASHKTGAFETGKKLRHMPVEFVSAGRLEGTIKKREPAMADSASSFSSNVDSDAPSSPGSVASADNTPALAHMAIRSPSPALSLSSSSADEVVFKGRSQTAAPPANTAQISATGQPLASFPSVSHAATGALLAIPQPTSISAATSQVKTEHVQTTASIQLDIRLKPVEQDHDSEAEGVVQDEFARRRGGRPAWEGTTTPWVHRSKKGVGWIPPEQVRFNAFVDKEENARDAAMDDYMQNMEEFGFNNDLSTASGFARREMDLDMGSHNDWESASASCDDEIEDIEGNDGWNSDDLQDLEGMSTSSDVEETVVRILKRRTRKSGPQYLCVFKGSSVDDASWLPPSLIQSAAGRKLIHAFEDEITRREEMLVSSDSSDSGHKDDEDEEDTDEEEEELDDETLARVLQKQEDLGLGSSEVLLYGGDDFFSGSQDPYPSLGGFSRSSKKGQGRTRGRGNRDPTFPSASAMADALAMDPYGGFDIMDTERPSLRQKKKGRRGPLPPELNDEDLNDQLQKSWAADRDKKRLKKAEREELRQQGLLGRKGKGANLKVKYQGGIGMEDIVEEIREFLMGDMQSLALPPMEAHRRAVVHQAAAFFNLTSRSRGDGQERFTILAKTTRTRSFTDDEFDIAIQKKGFQKRLRGPLGSRSQKGATVRHSNRVRPKTGYQDGDTVGANAPELGPENKGHALLSKMGWSKGTGLGALDNKGILQPIPHTVKINKAGLQ